MTFDPPLLHPNSQLVSLLQFKVMAHAMQSIPMALFAFQFCILREMILCSTSLRLKGGLPYKE